MSYNQTHQMKQFVKAKPLAELKDKSVSYQRQTKKNNKKYEQKSFQQAKDPRDHIKFLLNQFHKVEKDSIITNLCAKFPNLFTLGSSKPEPEIQGSLTEYVVFGNKKQPQPKYIKQISSDSSDPNWESDEEKEIKLASKKIDESIIQKVSSTVKKQQPKKLNDLQKHEKQFLEEYYRKKRTEQQNQEQIEEEERKQNKEQTRSVIRKEINEQKVEEIQKKVEEKKVQEGEDWAEYDVGALITEGIIQEVKKGQDDGFEMDDDFSYQDEQSKSSSSSQDDDNMFADEGPRTITKTKQDIKQEAVSKPQRKEIVQISNHTFTQIAEQLGVHPESCVWIISNRQQRYRVSTLYMNEYYRFLASAFQYISLNHSQFVHNDEIQTEKGLQKLKKNDHRRKVSNYNSNRANGRPQPPHYKQKK